MKKKKKKKKKKKQYSSLKDLTNFNSKINPPSIRYNAHAYALVILIGTFSGAWPYLKLITMLYCWLASPSKMAPKRRGQILMFLDTLGKWSLIDVFVLVMCMVSFRLHIISPASLLILPEDFYVVDVQVREMLQVRQKKIESNRIASRKISRALFKLTNPQK